MAPRRSTTRAGSRRHEQPEGRRPTRNSAIRRGHVQTRRGAATAMALAVLGDRAGAVRLAERALALAPDDHVVQYNVACVHAALGEAERAIDLLERAMPGCLRAPVGLAGARRRRRPAARPSAFRSAAASRRGQLMGGDRPEPRAPACGDTCRPKAVRPGSARHSHTPHHGWRRGAAVRQGHHLS